MSSAVDGPAIVGYRSHGRNSGVAFVVPWDRIAPVIDSMKEGRGYRLPRVGVSWPLDLEAVPKISGLQKDGPAEKAGLVVGDLIVKVGDVDVKTVADCTRAFIGHFAGEHLALTVARGGAPVVIDLVLGSRD